MCAAPTVKPRKEVSRDVHGEAVKLLARKYKAQAARLLHLLERQARVPLAPVVQRDQTQPGEVVVDIPMPPPVREPVPEVQVHALDKGTKQDWEPCEVVVDSQFELAEVVPEVEVPGPVLGPNTPHPDYDGVPCRCVPEPAPADYWEWVSDRTRPAGRVWPDDRVLPDLLLLVLIALWWGVLLPGAVVVYPLMWVYFAMRSWDWMVPRIIHPCFSCAVNEACEKTWSDRELVAFGYRSLMLGGRDVGRLKELKLKAEQQCRRAYGESVSEMRMTDSVLNLFQACSMLLGHEIHWQEQLAEYAEGMHTAHNFSTRGVTASGAQLPQR